MCGCNRIHEFIPQLDNNNSQLNPKKTLGIKSQYILLIYHNFLLPPKKGGGGALKGNLALGVLARSSNPDPIQDKIRSF